MNHIDLWALFASSFLASTLLPGGSEVSLVLIANNSSASLPLLLGIATLGNTLGGMTSWGIGWWIRKRFPATGLKKPAHKKAMQRISQYGSPILLLSWLPIIGDPLCVAAGWARIHFFPALLFIALGKAARYWVVLYLVSF